jgi:hypothetical protein
MEFRCKINDHNFDMARAGPTFGADNFREIILGRVNSIQTHALQLSNKILN